MKFDNRLRTAASKLLAYCEARNWAGYDPYDALNSKAFAALPLFRSRLPRLIFTQILKRTPIDVRRLLLIPKTQNPKAIALFLSAFLTLSRLGISRTQTLVETMIERLIALRSHGTPYWCWGYNFPWQTRTVLVPAGAPNLVCISFVGNALLDAFEQLRDERCLAMAVSSAEYILNELYWSEGNSIAGFSYPAPNLRHQVPNANLLGASFLLRVYKYTGEQKYFEPALRVARCAAALQRLDGAWYYGTAPSQRWIDNFHTGYNLCALQAVGRYAETAEFESHVKRGLEFYRANFFREDGAPKYFPDRSHPVDIHCVAQSIITLLSLKDHDPANVPLAQTVFEWAMRHMWDERGFFYYQVHQFHTIRIPYMRWAQAWMLLATSQLLCEAESVQEDRVTHSGSAVLAQVC
jgi:rhamnogalacturonyl hydrolase YesR